MDPILNSTIECPAFPSTPVPADIIKWTWAIERIVARNKPSPLTDLAMRHLSHMRELSDDFVKHKYRGLAQYFDNIAIAKTALMPVLDDLMTKRNALSQGKGIRQLDYDTIAKAFIYKNKSYHCRKETNYVKLCDVFYEDSPHSGRSGKMSWQELAKRMKQKFPELPTIDREFIRQTLRSLEDWSTNPKQDLGKVLQLQGADVVMA